MSDLLPEIETFLKQSGLSPGRFGQLSAKNARLVERLRAGGRIWPETAEQIRAWMAENRNRRVRGRAA